MIKQRLNLGILLSLIVCLPNCGLYTYDYKSFGNISTYYEESRIDAISDSIEIVVIVKPSRVGTDQVYGGPYSIWVIIEADTSKIDSISNVYISIKDINENKIYSESIGKSGETHRTTNRKNQLLNIFIGQIDLLFADHRIEIEYLKFKGLNKDKAKHNILMPKKRKRGLGSNVWDGMMSI